jgi:hypothetical protein
MEKFNVYNKYLGLIFFIGSHLGFLDFLKMPVSQSIYIRFTLNFKLEINGKIQCIY